MAKASVAAGSDQHLNNRAVELAQEERAFRRPASAAIST